MKWKFLSNGFIYGIVQDIIGGTRARKLAIERIIKDNPRLKGQELTVLDVGCGPGDILRWLPKSWKYFGIDISSDYIKLAKKKWSTRGMFVQGKSCDIINLVPQNSQDIILFLGVLHHLDSRQVVQSLINAKRVLKETGFVYALEPAFTNGQTKISKFIMQLDRGSFIREINDWEELCKSVFQKVEVRWLPGALRIPYYKITISMPA